MNPKRVPGFVLLAALSLTFTHLSDTSTVLSPAEQKTVATQLNDNAEVLTNTGTIHADVPAEALKVRFEWESSRPRFLSDIELPRVKEGRGGVFSIAGTRILPGQVSHQH